MVYYGETVGFVAAWAAGLVILAFTASDEPASAPAVDQVAIAETTAPSAGSVR